MSPKRTRRRACRNSLADTIEVCHAVLLDLFHRRVDSVHRQLRLKLQLGCARDALRFGFLRRRRDVCQPLLFSLGQAIEDVFAAVLALQPTILLALVVEEWVRRVREAQQHLVVLLDHLEVFVISVLVFAFAALEVADVALAHLFDHAQQAELLSSLRPSQVNVLVLLALLQCERTLFLGARFGSFGLDSSAPSRLAVRELVFDLEQFGLVFCSSALSVVQINDLLNILRLGHVRELHFSISIATDI